MKIDIPDLAALPAAAQQLAAAIAESGHSVVAFEGEMGAGKTTLIRALGAAMGRVSQFIILISTVLTLK